MVFGVSRSLIVGRGQVVGDLPESWRAQHGWIGDFQSVTGTSLSPLATILIDASTNNALRPSIPS